MIQITKTELSWKCMSQAIELQSKEAQMGHKKGEIDRFTITFEDFNTHLSLNDRITRKSTS